MRRGRILRPLLLSVLGLSLSLTLSWWPAVSQPPVVQAHSFVIGSDPTEGSTISVMPPVIRLFFNEDVSPASSAHLFAPDGEIADARHSSLSSTNPRELDTPVITPNLLPQGSYLVRWTALSNADGHATSGAIGFKLGHASTGPAGQVILGPSTGNYLPALDMQGILAVAWEWLVGLALTFWVGMLVMEGFVLAGAEQPAIFTQARKQALPLQWLCLSVLLVGEIINFVLRSSLLTQASGNSGIDLSALRQVLFETNYGRLWLIRLALIVIALSVLRWANSSQRATSNTAILRRRRSRSHFSQLRQQVTQEQAQDVSKSNSSQEEESGQSSHEQSPSPSATSSSPRSRVEERLAPALPPQSRNRPASQRRYTLAWLVLAGLLLLTLAPSEDVVQLVPFHMSATVLNWLYLVAQAIWFGGAAYLGYLLLPLLPATEPGRSAETQAMLLHRYTPLMLGAIGVLLASGLFLSEASIGTIQQLLTNPYGRALLVKLLLFALMLILGGYALFFLRLRLTRQAIVLPVVDAELPARRTRQSAREVTENSLKRTTKMQAWLGAGVLLCAALMSFFAPPIVLSPLNNTTSTTSLSATSIQNIQTKRLGDLSVTLQVLPARIHYANTVIITMLDSQGYPVTNAQVELATNMEVMDMGTAYAVIKGGNSTYTARFDKDAAFFMFGLWDIGVRIFRPNHASVQGIFQVTLTG